MAVQEPILVTLQIFFGEEMLHVRSCLSNFTHSAYFSRSLTKVFHGTVFEL